ncbi:hypothetical protein O6H91_10G033700 [Diphasiastrum complanatum]|uniref:Uncharacterized protein n=1 Tax=Diphasiastrum complanatum TaxID=34168 RepID=A0ACC2CFT5_DIPCM|nr:hypothetical protein O6H91_10G033700 [Diphasiastrum complanatum]
MNIKCKLLAKYIGKKRILAETGAGQHGVATATVCARFGLECVVYMGAQDMERQALNVFRMRLLGAKEPVVQMPWGCFLSLFMMKTSDSLGWRQLVLVWIAANMQPATLTKGKVGVLQGAMSYLLQDDDGQIIEPHSIIESEC